MEVAIFVIALALAGGLIGGGIMGAPGGGSWTHWYRARRTRAFDYGEEDPRR